jgi:signal transduction histidine kinase
MVAHDIRGPLTDMLLSLDLAKYVDRGDEKGLRDLLERFRGTTAQLRRLVNDLVDAQATEDGQRRYLREEVDVVALLRDASLSLQDSAACKGIELRVETEEQTMAIISDGAALRQVVDNLVSNALKFTGPETVVTIAARWNGDGLKLSVADQGPGIRAEERERIFTRYGQGAAKPTGGEKSTGLGLWIVRNVVAGLGGDVRCESEVGHGATFIVDLPRRVRSRAAA